MAIPFSKQYRCYVYPEYKRLDMFEEYLIHEILPMAFQSLNIYQTKFAYNFPNRVMENRQMSDMLASIKQV